MALYDAIHHSMMPKATKSYNVFYDNTKIAYAAGIQKLSSNNVFAKY